MISDLWQKLRNPWIITGLVLSALVILGLGMFVGQTINYMRSIQAGEPNPFIKDQLEANMSRLLMQTPPINVDRSRLQTTTQNPTLGNPEAKIRIIEFLDYECPFCRRTAPAVRAFMARHASDVYFTVRDFPIESIHKHAMPAAIAARCVFLQGDINKYWLYHDLLFQNQERLEAPDLRAYAARVGVDLSGYDACVESRQPEKDIRASYEDGLAVGVSGTPTFFINNIPVAGALSLEAIEAIYESVMQKI